MKIKLSLTIFLCLLFLACNDAVENYEEELAIELPYFISRLETESISSELAIYDNEGALTHESELIIEGNSVLSSTISLVSGSTYHFVVKFYYYWEGEYLCISYVYFSHVVGDESAQLSYSEGDFVTDFPEDINNDLSASFNVGLYEIPNLDDDGDGISNLTEITLGLDPFIFDENSSNSESNLGSEITISLNSPGESDELVPTYAILSWEANSTEHTPDHYVLCFTEYGEPALNDEEDCYNETIVSESYYIMSLDYTLTSDVTYWWKVKACYDEEESECTLFSEISNFVVLSELVGWWQFNEAEGDSVGNSSINSDLIGTMNGFTSSPNWLDPSLCPGYSDSCVVYDGVASHAEMNHDDAYNFSRDSFSVSLWVKYSVDGGIIISKENMNTLGAGWYLESLGESDGYDAGTLRWKTGNGSEALNLVPEQTGLNDGNWHHIVFVRDVDHMAVYVDAVEGEVVNTSAYDINNSVSLRIGGDLSFYSGSIDDVAIVSTALTETAISANYCSIKLLAIENGSVESKPGVCDGY